MCNNVLCMCFVFDDCVHVQVLYLMDKFDGSDELYHELSMVLPCAPRSYKVKEMRAEINSRLRSQLHRVPAPHNGVYCCPSERIMDEIEKLVSDMEQFEAI